MCNERFNSLFISSTLSFVSIRLSILSLDPWFVLLFALLLFAAAFIPSGAALYCCSFGRKNKKGEDFFSPMARD